MDKLTLIIPAKHESDSLPIVLKDLKKYNVKIIIILEKNDTKTIDSIKSFDNYKLIFQNGKGYGDAIITGINNTETDFFSIFNADGSFDPEELSIFLSLVKNNNFDLVFASRYQNNSGSEDDTIITYIGNKIFTLIGKFLFRLPITDILYTYIVGKTDIVKKLDLKQKDFRFCVELPIKAKKKKLNIISSSSYERKRIAGKKKVNELRDGFLILIHMINLFFTK